MPHGATCELQDLTPGLKRSGTAERIYGIGRPFRAIVIDLAEARRGFSHHAFLAVIQIYGIPLRFALVPETKDAATDSGSHSRRSLRSMIHATLHTLADLPRYGK